MRKILEIDKEEVFFSGTILRKYSVGLGVSESDDYYDYILAYAQWEKGKMMLVNITKEDGKNKAGSVYGGVLQGGPSVKKEHFLYTLDDISNWYILDEE